MPDDLTQQVEFRSPTTGAVQVVPPEHWDEALKNGYLPSSHVIMYDSDGNRGMVPKGLTGVYRDQGYTIRPETDTNRGFLGTLWDKLSSLIPSKEQWQAESNAPQPTTKEEMWKRNELLRNDIEKAPVDLGKEIGRQATRPIPKDLPTGGSVGRGIYRGATTLSPLIPFLNPEASEAASEKGDTGAVAAEAALPLATSLAPSVSKYAAKKTLPARTALAEKIVQPLVYEGVGEAGADTRFGVKPERGIVKEGIFGTRGSMKNQINNRLNLLKPAADNILQTAPGASTPLDATAAINSAVDDAITQATKNGQHGIIPRLEQLRGSLLSDHGPTSGAPLDINNLKTSIQDTAQQLGAFKNTVPAEASAATAAGRAGSNVRSQVNTAVPEAAPLNERMSDIIDARSGLQRGIEASKGNSVFGNKLEGMTSRILNNTVGSPFVRSTAARLISLGAKADIPSPLPVPPTFRGQGPVVGPAGQTAPFGTGGTGPMLTPPQTSVPTTGPGGNVALFPDIPSGQAPHPTLGAGEVPNWPPKVPDWSPVNNAPPIPPAESTIPQETPYGPSPEQGPPPLPPGVTPEQWNAMPTALRNTFGSQPPAPGAYSPGAAVDVTPKGAPLPSSTPPITVAPPTQPPVPSSPEGTAGSFGPPEDALEAARRGGPGINPTIRSIGRNRLRLQKLGEQ